MSTAHLNFYTTTGTTRSMTMQILVYGATDIGYMIAARLYLEHDITIVDEHDRLPENSIISISVLSQAVAPMFRHSSGRTARRPTSLSPAV